MEILLRKDTSPFYLHFSVHREYKPSPNGKTITLETIKGVSECFAVPMSQIGQNSNRKYRQYIANKLVRILMEDTLTYLNSRTIDAIDELRSYPFSYEQVFMTVKNIPKSYQETTGVAPDDETAITWKVQIRSPFPNFAKASVKERNILARLVRIVGTDVKVRIHLNKDEPGVYLGAIDLPRPLEFSWNDKELLWEAETSGMLLKTGESLDTSVEQSGLLVDKVCIVVNDAAVDKILGHSKSNCSGKRWVRRVNEKGKLIYTPLPSKVLLCVRNFKDSVRMTFDTLKKEGPDGNIVKWKFNATEKFKLPISGFGRDTGSINDSVVCRMLSRMLIQDSYENFSDDFPAELLSNNPLCSEMVGISVESLNDLPYVADILTSDGRIRRGYSLALDLRVKLFPLERATSSVIERNVLTRLYRLLGDDMKLQVCFQNVSTLCFTGSVLVQDPLDLTWNEGHLMWEGKTKGHFLINSRDQMGRDFCIRVVGVRLLLSKIGVKKIVWYDLRRQNIISDTPLRNLSLMNGESTDMAIVIDNGIQIRCHRTVMAAASPYFASMFKGDVFKESKTGLVPMPGKTEDGVHALLDFIYNSNVEKISQNSDLAVELLQAGDQFGMLNLVTFTTTVLMIKSKEWYSVDALVELFCLARNLEGGCWHELKFKSRQVFDWYLEENMDRVIESQKFIELYEKCEAVALDLSPKLANFVANKKLECVKCRSLKYCRIL